MPPRLAIVFTLALAALTSFTHAKEPVHTADTPLPPEKAARTMLVPEGFHVTLFAGEPDIVQPVGFCIDDRGRLWVAEAHNYPAHGDRPGDRIVILDDTDGDGRFDERTVFYDQLNYVTGIEVGFGGAWVMSPPHFYFIPDADSDGVPDGEPRVVLTGFGNHANAHNLANGFAWGPDGWLYGTHGRTNWSMIREPDTPDDEGTRFDGGVYRYHPVTKEWEPYADGTTNPWGIDWNEHGEAFVSNCVNPHLFHVIQGAHYEPWRGRDSSRHAYQRLETIADHLHYPQDDDIRNALGSETVNALGGGHAHCGMMVYLGDSFPEKYRNTVFMNNIHGRRINNDIPRRQGSGYVASHGDDFMVSQDPWFMGVLLQYGPGGEVYAIDWSDTGECHSTRNTQRETGRLYRISYGDSFKSPRTDLAALDHEALFRLQFHRNDWQARHARRLLQERHAAGHNLSAVRENLTKMLHHEDAVPKKLRALWTLHVTGGLDDDTLVALLGHGDEHLRAWAVRLLCEDGDPPAVALDRFRELAATGRSPLVRRYLASALQRLHLNQRWEVAGALVARGGDAADQNLPSMVWYGIEPLIDDDLEKFVALAETAEIPQVRQNLARRAVTDPVRTANALGHLSTILARAKHPGLQRDLVLGILEGLQGRRSVAMPDGWEDALRNLLVSGNDLSRDAALRLALVFDDPHALAELRAIAANPGADAGARHRALDALLGKRPKDLAPLLFELLDDEAVRGEAIRGLAAYRHEDTVDRLLALYPKLDLATRRDIVQTLASRPGWADALLDAVESGALPRADLTAYTARQLQNLGDDELTARVRDLWGDVRATPAAKRKLIAEYKRQLTPETMATADPAAGRVLFQNLCASCHRLFGEGGELGPEITGSQRSNLDYLLENLVDPSAAVSKDYRMQVITTTDGRTLTGFIVTESEVTLTLQSLNEQLVLPINEIATREESKVSIMPEGLLQVLTPEQRQNLIAYLSSPHQVE